MDANQIRKAYLDFFKQKNHTIIPAAKLTLEDDPTTLFTGAGMQPLLPYLLGKNHPMGTRLTDSQPCLRAQDIEEVGDNRHTTFFEMLGNWSLGDYFKQQQISWFFEFLTDVVGLDPAKIYVSVFAGSKKYNIPRDNEAAKIWQELFAQKGIEAKIVEIGSKEQGDERGIRPGERIFFYDDNENWWSRGDGLAGTPIGDPCGPDSEVFYDFGNHHHDEKLGKAHPAGDSGRFMEIGNQVFMQYERLSDGSFAPLTKKNVDFGGGLERIAAAKLNDPDVFKISLLWPTISKIEKLSQKSYDEYQKNMRVIADHLRAAVFLALDGCAPANKEQGYVMRRLLRRAIRFASELGIEQNLFAQLVPVVVDIYKNNFKDLETRQAQIIEILAKEEKIFRQTLKKGLVQLQKIADQRQLSGEDFFLLYDTFGFPLELSSEEAYRRNYKISKNWRAEFKQEMAKQRLRSQTAAKGTFKGGLEGNSSQHKKYHTATHLLQAALRQVFGNQLLQRGSNITSERLRFDFNLDHKMTPEEIKQVEQLVNNWIEQDLPINFKTYSTSEALKLGALGAFGERYGETVKVYEIGLPNNIISREICGGPHVDSTAVLAEGDKKFKISKEESSSAGVRRIKAVLI